MRWLAAGVTFLNVAVVSALLIGMAADGLTHVVAKIAFVLGLLVAGIAFAQTRDPARVPVIAEGDDATAPAEGRASHVWPKTIATPQTRHAEACPSAAFQRYGRILFWILAGCFGFFTFRAFGWVMFLDGNQWKVQSPNNLGDLSLHIAYIKNFALGVPIWPENPIHVGSFMRYPAGTDLFNALLLELDISLVRGLVWAGVLGSLATFYALYRWGGEFGVAGFLFNGGIAGFQVLETWKLIDYQGGPDIAWKSLPLSMLVTQRGLLYALPAGLLLLCHWRGKYFPRRDMLPHVRSEASTTSATRRAEARPSEGAIGARGILPFWLELLFYATMPLFHMHTFIALSIVLAFLFCIGLARFLFSAFNDYAMCLRLGALGGLALLPATFLVYTITDRFRARSMIEWEPGWVQTKGEFAAPFFKFWFLNFGLWLPLALLAVGMLWYRAWRSLGNSAAAEPAQASDEPAEAMSAALAKTWAFLLRVPALLRSSPALAFITPAALLFLFAALVKTAPWEWDNIKIFIWAYLIALPFLWSELIARWPLPVRIGLCIALFGSGFVSLFGGLLSERQGFGFADRAELDAVGKAVEKLPEEARFAAFPTYNHLLLLQGRKVVLGYPGHLWTQGFDYAPVHKNLEALMRGAPDWRQKARELNVQYLFWGKEEKTQYAGSTRPWEREALLLASGPWGAIYDINATAAAPNPGVR